VYREPFVCLFHHPHHKSTVSRRLYLVSGLVIGLSSWQHEHEEFTTTNTRLSSAFHTSEGAVGRVVLHLSYHTLESPRL
jgi:hypothetical protein